jgi:hypothetical protein
MAYAELEAALHQEVEYLLKKGLSKSQPEQEIPVMADLAKKLSPQRSVYDAIWVLMDWSIRYATPEVSNVVLRVWPDTAQGLREMFGLTDHRQQGLKARWNRAGSFLGPLAGVNKGYEKLRQKMHDGQRLEDIIIDNVTRPLTDMARKHEFTFSGFSSTDT